MVKDAMADPNHPIHLNIEKQLREEAAYRELVKPQLKLSRSGIKPPPPRRGKRKWR
ncbi:MAG TPA: hypothetical protein VIM11_15840 [Tepidisphaeraceae bacterium]|jgi:hypothetical protein